VRRELAQVQFVGVVERSDPPGVVIAGRHAGHDPAARDEVQRGRGGHSPVAVVVQCVGQGFEQGLSVELTESGRVGRREHTLYRTPYGTVVSAP
jgi:hypothetical protein